MCAHTRLLADMTSVDWIFSAAFGLLGTAGVRFAIKAFEPEDQNGPLVFWDVFPTLFRHRQQAAAYRGDQQNAESVGSIGNAGCMSDGASLFDERPLLDDYSVRDYPMKHAEKVLNVMFSAENSAAKKKKSKWKSTPVYLSEFEAELRKCTLKGASKWTMRDLFNACGGKHTVADTVWDVFLVGVGIAFADWAVAKPAEQRAEQLYQLLGFSKVVTADLVKHLPETFASNLVPAVVGILQETADTSDIGGWLICRAAHHAARKQLQRLQTTTMPNLQRNLRQSALRHNDAPRRLPAHV